MQQYYRAPNQFSSNVQVEDGHLKNTLPLDITIQSDGPAGFPEQKRRVPYSQYPGIPTLEPAAKPIEEVPQEGRSQKQKRSNEDAEAPGRSVKDPPIDNGGPYSTEKDYWENSGEATPGVHYHKQNPTASSKSPEKQKETETADYIDREMGHVLDEAKYLVERDA